MPNSMEILIEQYQKMLLIATNAWAQESAKSELRLRSYKGFKLIG
jgi:hypothetical protein